MERVAQIFVALPDLIIWQHAHVFFAHDQDGVLGAKGLTQISDEGALERIVDEVLAANEGVVAEYRSGKEKAFNSLVGKAMQATKGKANPAQVNAILKKKLDV